LDNLLKQKARKILSEVIKAIIISDASKTAWHKGAYSKLV